MTVFKVLCWIGGILLFWGFFQLPSKSGDVASRQTLSISEEPDRIVLGWSGPVQEPMSERVAAALDRYKADRRRLVLILNSPGGSIEHGRKVVATIRGRDRAIDTLVQKAGVCASMCVPIFLAGTRRMADPEAYFMFHQASLNIRTRDIIKRQELSASDQDFLSQAVKTIETIEAQATEDLFRNDIGIRGVSAAWLTMMRKKISGHDVWVSGQQLVDEGSGIVDNLVRTPVPQRG
ncbi:ATP-dependent Clp protease proteolytic subunit [Bradyrhizobium diazoefficiens]|uniref:ATP-dependent Clp protease proteolytic subunit n=1 Tax=Bradyrhizobium diazoefficiens TaxID=1355477 RepID=UPI001909F216|nr:ATP-dependent Clp protease proteolytic subunit [Bradyrhizobium diazoefficiens]QQO13516.1 ATP-dependent Clp protease proteolytic subunit [Bradyrhizobium diazoefficiens]